MCEHISLPLQTVNATPPLDPSQARTIWSEPGRWGQILGVTHMEPASLSEDSLKEACTRETANYLRRRQNDPRYCYRAFPTFARRFTNPSDGLSYGKLIAAEVQTWTRSHAAFEQSGLEADELVGSAFMRLYRSCSGDAFHDFADLACPARFLTALCAKHLDRHCTPRQAAATGAAG